MLRSVKNLQGFQILATDGAIGSADEFYFDDERWAIRYLVVDTGKWLPGREVLISPMSIRQTDWSTNQLSLAITRAQVKNSPDIDTHKPVSRQQEATYSRYYGYPYYWGSSALWGPAMYPSGLAVREMAEMDAHVDAEQERAQAQGDDHLRRTKEVTGYHIQASDGEIGHVSDFLVDDESWAIRYLVVNTSNWWFGHKVLVAPDWIGGVSWNDKKVTVDVTRDTVKSAPLFDEVAHLDRQWETDYYSHYRRAPYWPAPDHARSAAVAASGLHEDATPKLVSLNDHGELGVAEQDQDPRGWKVVASGDPRTLGKVDDLILDTSTMKVRYLVVDRDEASGGRTSENRRILLPVGRVRLGPREELATVEGLNAEDLARLPVYTSLPVTPGYDEEFGGYVRGDVVSRRDTGERATAADWSVSRRNSKDR